MFVTTPTQELGTLEYLEEFGDGGSEAARRRRLTRMPRRRIHRPPPRHRPRAAVTRRRPTARAARRAPTRLRRRRPAGTMPRPGRLPIRRPRPARPVRPPIHGPRPVRVIRRYIPVPYPRPYPVDVPAAPVRGRPGAILTGFRFDRAALRHHHLPQIRQLAQHVVASWRNRQPIRTIRLVGHGDTRGSARHNRQLGMQRARAARAGLIRELDTLWPGLQRRIQLISQTAGDTQPIASNRTVPGRALNRRVAIFLSRA